MSKKNLVVATYTGKLSIETKNSDLRGAVFEKTKNQIGSNIPPTDFFEGCRRGVRSKETPGEYAATMSRRRSFNKHPFLEHQKFSRKTTNLAKLKK